MIPVKIEDADIDEIARFMGRDFDATECRQVLKARETLDVQAAPGSGKTTLLVAKLALLGARWPHARQGICVLSHTNVARREVETRLQHHPAGRALLGYPHFIGTIQTFAHQCLALPYLRGLGVTPRSVDDVRFTAAARRLVGQNTFWHARNHLERHPNTAESILSSLTLSGPDLALICGEKLPSATTKTFESFYDLKAQLIADGVFRFADMFAFAQRALRDVPQLAEAVSTRFHAAAPIIWEGLMAFLHNHGCELSTGEPIGKKSVLRALDEAAPDASVLLLTAMHECCLGPTLAEASWKMIVQSFVTSLKTLASTIAVTDDFLIWDPHSPMVENVGAGRRNTFEHLAGDRSVLIDLNTIAGVKGETHDATLVLTTSKSKVFDLREALGPLSRTAAARPAKTIPPQLMNLFVGITRPKSLLCLAVVADHITEAQKSALIANGWLIQDLRPLG